MLAGTVVDALANLRPMADEDLEAASLDIFEGVPSMHFAESAWSKCFLSRRSMPTVTLCCREA
jgi:hypothetical protein